MFERNETLNASVEVLLAAVEKKTRGELLSYAEIAECTGMDRSSQGWKSFIDKFIRELRKREGIAVRCVPNVGYKMLDANEQVLRCSRDRAQRASRQLFRAQQEVKAVGQHELTPHMQRLRAGQLQALRKNRSASISQVRELNQQSEASETIPKRHFGEAS